MFTVAFCADLNEKSVGFPRKEFISNREERGLRVFENRVARGIFGAKRDEVTGEWRKLS
jgi:hypothetical protein